LVHVLAAAQLRGFVRILARSPALESGTRQLEPWKETGPAHRRSMVEAELEKTRDEVRYAIDIGLAWISGSVAIKTRIRVALGFDASTAEDMGDP
jgi:hypothetical protein